MKLTEHFSLAELTFSATAQRKQIDNTPPVAIVQNLHLLAAGLQSDLGMTYDATRIGQWRRGERAIPQPVQDWMLRACIAYAIGQCGGISPSADANLDRLAAMLCPPAR